MDFDDEYEDKCRRVANKLIEKGHGEMVIDSIEEFDGIDYNNIYFR